MRKLASLALAVAAVGMVSSVRADMLELQQWEDGYTGMQDVIIRSDGTNASTPQVPQNLNWNNPTNQQQLLVGLQSTRDFRTLFSYDLSPLEALANGGTVTITSISLSVKVVQAQGTNSDFSVTLSSYGSFDRNTATWNLPTGTGSTDVAGGTPGTLLSQDKVDATVAGSLLEFGSSAEFVAAANAALAGDNVLNMMLWTSINSNNTTDFVRLAGARYPSIDEQAPSLTITYTVASVPEAASLGLLGLGALALIRRR